MYVIYVTSQYVGDIIFQQGVTKCDEGEGGGKNMAKKRDVTLERPLSKNKNTNPPRSVKY